MRARKLAGTAGLALLAGLPVAAFGDTVTLKNGKEIHGRLVEETEELIRIRSGGGVITLQKAEIATFSENENWGDYGREVPPPPADKPAEKDPKKPADKPADKPKPGDKPKAADKPGEPRTWSKETWKWPAGLSEEKIAELTPIRDEHLKELEKLGPTPAERLKKIELHPEEKDKLDQLVNRLDFQQQQGSANMIRRKARDRVINELGPKAIPTLSEGVKQDANYWRARISAEALELLNKDEDARWLMYHFDAPSGLVNLLRHQGDFGESPHLRNQANKTLEALTKHKESWPDSTETMRTPAETEAMERWVAFWAREKRRWDAAEKEKEERRAELIAGLEKLAKGENPEGENED